MHAARMRLYKCRLHIGFVSINHRFLLRLRHGMLAEFKWLADGHLMHRACLNVAVLRSHHEWLRLDPPTLYASVSCLSLLMRHHSDDLDMCTIWLCAWNDVIANGDVLLVAAGVAITGPGWPDILTGLLITGLYSCSLSAGSSRHFG
jgi:hypothetical protein